jgi:hypothetical protein
MSGETHGRSCCGDMGVWLSAAWPVAQLSCRVTCLTSIATQMWLRLLSTPWLVSCSSVGLHIHANLWVLRLTDGSCPCAAPGFLLLSQEGPAHE